MVQVLIAAGVLVLFLQRDSMLLPLCRPGLRCRIQALYGAVMFAGVLVVGELCAQASPQTLDTLRSPAAWFLAIVVQGLLLLRSRDAEAQFLDGRPWLLAVIPSPLLLASFGLIVFAIRCWTSIAAYIVPLLALGWIAAVLSVSRWQVRSQTVLIEPRFGLTLSWAVSGTGIALIPLLLS